MATVTAFGITAESTLWQAIGAHVYNTDAGLVFARWESWADGNDRAILIEAAKAKGLVGGAALADVDAEIRRRREHADATRVQHNLAGSIQALATAIGAESAESLVQRLPERLRPYVEAVLRTKQRKEG